jgi:hypothetical protein
MPSSLFAAKQLVLRLGSRDIAAPRVSVLPARGDGSFYSETFDFVGRVNLPSCKGKRRFQYRYGRLVFP